MNRDKLSRILMVVFAVLALMAASTPGAVMVFDPAQPDDAQYYSFFHLIEEYDWALALPAAGVMCGLSLTFACAQLFAKDNKWSDRIIPVAFAATTLSVLPLIIAGEKMIVPDVLVALSMLAQSFVAWLRKAALIKQMQKKKEPRLDQTNI